MINLLPPKAKQKLKLSILEREIIIVGSLIISLVLSLMIFLGVIFLILYRNQIQVQESNVLLGQAQELEEQVSALNKELANFINQQLEYISQIQKSQISWSAILEKLAQITPSNTRLEFLEILDNKVQINGFARSRDDVLSFQRILEQEKQFTEIESPLSNFVKQKDINFTFSFKLKQ